ncbi:helix-turn-helix domain-containing protein [Caballeronia sordidicola]|jgi:transcriptional regulator with XRE-family HTH domain|uniref:Putative transcriptional regulator n=1 Tax=Caballeronia sordidicola TaxID=196367 RepID=A0A226X1I8_CABSO|nr:helix-turn-helix transcriptional regulator [Caballeronia sordidicola]OXC76877.1 putative transcriptional regulator [Caballeronia sordidicola]
MSHQVLTWWTMDFPKRLAALRKQRSLTQQALTDLAGVHLSQMKRYEGGTSQPTLDVLRSIAIAFSVSADVLLFDEQERGPDYDFRLRFEAISRLDADERNVIKELIDGTLLKHEARRLSMRANEAGRQ